MKSETIVILILVLFITIVGGICIYKIMGVENKLQVLDNSNWTCIAQVCDKIYNADEWVKSNCALNESNMTCSFIWNNSPYNFQLSNINASYMLENKVGNYCSLKCQTEVLIRNA